MSVKVTKLSVWGEKNVNYHVIFLVCGLQNKVKLKAEVVSCVLSVCII